ncbi:MAG: hypothetical protein Q8S09_08730 [Hyphomonas sp.]|nr:hypothetical protein [Hyphomonas sp.]
MRNTPDVPPYADAAPQRKSRRGWWILGGLGLAAVLLGMCVKGGVDLFAAIGERSAASVAIAKQFTASGLPTASDPIYSRRSGVNDDAVEKVNRLIAQFGSVSDFTDASCTLNSAANTNATESGTFANCALSANSDLSPVDITVRWIREDEAWKLLAFNLNYTDQSLLLDKAEELDRRAREEGGPAERPPPEMPE